MESSLFFGDYVPQKVDTDNTELPIKANEKPIKTNVWYW